jgi:hypothetical protein
MNAGLRTSKDGWGEAYWSAMAETFLILFAGGVLLAAAVPRPADVTLNWLRLAGIIALCLCGLAAFFYFRRGPVANVPAFYRRMQVGLIGLTVVCVLAQLALAQTARRRAQRVMAMLGFVVGVLAGSNLLHELMIARGTALSFAPKPLAVGLQTLSCAGVGAMTGLALMDMLLGHAYLTASKMTIAPFRRLNLALVTATVLRALIAIGGALALQSWRPVERLWAFHGLFILTRWLVGLAVPLVFLYMAHDCIKRRSTQSATGILYVAGVLVLIGELIGLYLVRETGLPF